MRMIPTVLLLLTASSPALADCTQMDAVGKMQSILSSSEYSAFVSQAGTTKPTSQKRENLKSGLRNYGGNFGRSIAGSMQDEDTADQVAQAQASVATVTALNQTLNNAGTALGQGDNAKACTLYDSIIKGLGIPQ